MTLIRFYDSSHNSATNTCSAYKCSEYHFTSHCLRTLSYRHTHTCTHARTHAHTHTHSSPWHQASHSKSPFSILMATEWSACRPSKMASAVCTHRSAGEQKTWWMTTPCCFSPNPVSLAWYSPISVMGESRTNSFGERRGTSRGMFRLRLW